MAPPTTPADKTSNIMPEENAVSSKTDFDGPDPRPRDKSPEHQYNPSPGDNNNRTDPDAPGGPVNIRVKGAAGDAPGQPDEQAEPDNGVTEETRAKTTGMGKAGV
ncbi:hypothetical protein [Roseomonas sp. BN140053]|uniref:hypothetical protein n=1 Tax=Roseomonas sp. BN140053 TaxID=3391898 RepID=UPI0039E87F84